jgi:hypothetical protein
MLVVSVLFFQWNSNWYGMPVTVSEKQELTNEPSQQIAVRAVTRK